MKLKKKKLLIIKMIWKNKKKKMKIWIKEIIFADNFKIKNGVLGLKQNIYLNVVNI
jgi:hypothetical protein